MLRSYAVGVPLPAGRRLKSRTAGPSPRPQAPSDEEACRESCLQVWASQFGPSAEL